MRKIFLCMIVVIIVAFVQNAFAEEIKIIGIQGDVLVRAREIAPWRRAAIGETVSKDYELLTKGRSKCTLSFDKNVDNLITVDEHSHIKIADILGRTIELSKGRVFSVIEAAKNIETFQIKTPTAIAGARGTGWMVDFITATLAKCFQGTIYVTGLNQEGNKMSEQDVGEGSGIEILSGGAFGDLFDLSDQDREAWNEFRGGLEDLKGAEENEQQLFSSTEQEMRNEQKEDFKEAIIKELRSQVESSGGNDGNGGNSGNDR